MITIAIRILTHGITVTTSFTSSSAPAASSSLHSDSTTSSAGKPSQPIST